MNIEIKTGNPRFNQLGDWPDYNTIVVADLPERYKFLIATHEFIESQLCKFSAITPQEVDKFDSEFEGEGEPGNDANCPYRIQHQLATIIEMMLCRELGIDFYQYEMILNHIQEVQNGKE